MGDVAYQSEALHYQVAVGETVVFVDPEGQSHEALVTCIFDRGDGHTPPSVNVVYVSRDPKAEDQYGRQLERSTSVVHRSQQAARGLYWSEAPEAL